MSMAHDNPPSPFLYLATSSCYYSHPSSITISLATNLTPISCSLFQHHNSSLRNILSSQMGICDCFKRIIGIKRKKENKPKKLELHQDSRNSDSSKSRYSTGNESGFLTSNTKVTVRSTGTKEFAATRIQTAFRAYRARKTLRYLKGASRFQALINADALTKQASFALDRIHFWSKIQAEISTRRVSMVTEDRIKQMRLENQTKLDSKLHEFEVEWCGGPEVTVSKVQQREEAANKRERAMAYAFSHQWRANSNRYFGQAYYDLSKESWGWSWRERWIPICRSEAHVVARPVVSTRAGQQKDGSCSETPDGKWKRYNKSS